MFDHFRYWQLLFINDQQLTINQLNHYYHNRRRSGRLTRCLSNRDLSVPEDFSFIPVDFDESFVDNMANDRIF